MIEEDEPPKRLFIKAVVSDQDCQNMAEKYNLTYVDAKPNGIETLEIDCYLFGEEPIFQEMWYDDQE
ncbi:MAG: hypothetical protein WA865_06010 [Spirulinaceae cyanobacterium]